MSEAERKRKGIAITVPRHASNEQTSRFSVMNTFVLVTAADIPSASGTEAMRPNDGLPHLMQVMHSKSTALTRQPNFDSLASRPSQAGSTAIFSTWNGAFMWELATICRGEEVVFRTLDIPDEVNVYVEFYSGAIRFRAKDRKSVVIQYFDQEFVC
ncbi:hypothetical protein DFH11DRAFT_1600020 [Phellopilus nigrolimitatus]|nr:hypothetical protein DFH11DRAFT_1600020 [Phellopilus nigrolimitatus]